ncbi:MAG TPA: 4Fe-4S binding protein [Methylomusa anaerophila]|uniref:Putative electron transport protein YccM n=1 Tax=Methylomusa anaerophila TaxID=1930071 RepID=A0A348AGH9_9FIRM|nr:4Fe-4S dicluster domain-containing protein [Methylomusa anaerophila]BBB90177.1 putative electron transport protein YccM [Methylomusa anaerophila]HML88097.1 4Fe-4S binding protein [Methylomusa anaerophila]
MFNRKFIAGQLRFWQFTLPAALFILSVYMILRLEYPLAGFTEWLLWISRLDPLLLFAYSGASHAIPHWVWLPVAVLLITALAGRIYCGWICPVGGLLGLLPNLTRYFPRRGVRAGLAGRGILNFLAKLKYWWLLLVVALLFAGNSILLIFTPSALLSHEIMRLYFQQIPWLLFAALGLGLVFFPRFWCVYVCPSGILMAAVACIRPAKLRIAAGCVDCGLCHNVCPVKTGKEKQGAAGGECLVCAACWSVCPVSAVTWKQISPRTEGAGQSRRDFITVGIGIIGAGFLSFFASGLFGRSRAAAQVLRPPGALPENDFLATCTRCGRCTKVCPSAALVPMPFASGLITFETPRFVPRKGRCELCMLCPKVCPSGALKDVAVADVKIGTAAIDKKTCLAWAQGKLCLVCAEQCPVHAVVMDEAKRPAIDAGKCVGCGACENSCPLEDPAVVVAPKSTL